MITLAEPPAVVRWVARVAPLYDGVELYRDAVTERVAFGATPTVGWSIARLSFTKRLGG